MKLSQLIIEAIKQPWLVSYDNVQPIKSMYGGFSQRTYNISYSAAKKFEGSELMVFSNDLLIPNDGNPLEAKLSKSGYSCAV